jgi:EAL domain-containing protein (putative c-di-GMP-specific phosphodiesterase class I)
MIRDADAAMYRAKAGGRNSYQVFDAQMHDQAVARLTLEHELRDALEKDQMQVHYQPIVSTTNGTIVGFEALARWNHPQRGLITPDSFMALAEETGVIIEIGEWVFRRACIQLVDWLKKFDHTEGFYVAVNLSRRQLIHPKITDVLARIICETGAPSERICLEITESAIMDQRQNSAELIRQLKSLGLKLALDDFGTGHSSLSCLHSFPIDVLKIDQSFIRNLGDSAVFSAVLNSIISLGHHLNMKIVGEGIESLDQLVQLQTLECDWTQGFYFAKPLPPAQATALLNKHPDWRLAA